MYTEEEIEAYKAKLDAAQAEAQFRLYRMQCEIYAELVRKLAEDYPHEKTQKTT